MTPPIEAAFRVWVFLAGEPLFWLALTLGAYSLGEFAAHRSGRHPVVNPVLIAVAITGAVLLVTHTPYQVYFAGAQFVHVLLGPATVALAVPIARNMALVRANAKPLMAALCVGGLTGVASAVGLAHLFGLEAEVVASLAPKSVTAAIAMGVAEKTGGAPALTATLVIATGILGAVMVTPLMNLLGLRDPAARGFAAGLSAHGIGTARALSVSETAGAFAGLAMGLNGLLTAILAPVVITLWR